MEPQGRPFEEDSTLCHIPYTIYIYISTLMSYTIYIYLYTPYLYITIGPGALVRFTEAQNHVASQPLTARALDFKTGK